MDEKPDNKNSNKVLDSDESKTDSKPRKPRHHKPRGFTKETSKKYNDWTWYAQNERMLKQCASLGFDVAAGDNNVPKVYGDNSVHQPVVTVPGIMVFHYLPIAGFTQDAASPLNVAVKSQYNQLLADITSVPPFEAVDYGKYMLAMDSIYQVYNYIKRLYGILKHYEFKNRYLPEGIFRALGEDFNDWQTNAPKYLWELNYAVNRVNARPVLSQMNYMIRHSWLVSNYFKDSDSQKAQMYVFRPSSFLEFTEATGSTSRAPYLSFTEPQYSGAEVDGINMRTGQDWIDYLNKLITSVLNSSDFDQIATWVLKSKKPFFTITEVEQSYELAPAYNAEVLNQIQNATLYGLYSRTYMRKNYTVEESVDSNKAYSYLYTPVNLVSDIPLTTSKLLNFNSEFVKEPEPKDVMTATRLTIEATNCTYPSEQLTAAAIAAGSVTKEMLYSYAIEGGPTEIISNVEMFFNVYTHETGENKYNHISLPVMWNSNYNLPNIAIPFTTFDYRPAIPCFDEGAQVSITRLAKPTQFFGFIQELDRYTILPPDDLNRMHITALLSLFGVQGTP